MSRYVEVQKQQPDWALRSHRARLNRECLVWLCLLFLALPGMALGQANNAAKQGGQPDRTTLKDQEFGVFTRQVGLQRRVEMYQWLRKGDGYAQDWHDAPVDSSGFAPQYANPGAFPLQTRYWIGQGITLDGKPLDENVLKVLGRWRQFRPGFTALPGNLSATFQPDGDGLSSSENPLNPQIGDLRVTWWEMALPPLTGQLTLHDGVWVLARAEPGRAVAVSVAESSSASTSANRTSDDDSTHWKIWAVLALVLGLPVLVWVLSRILRQAKRN